MLSAVECQWFAHDDSHVYWDSLRKNPDSGNTPWGSYGRVVRGNAETSSCGAMSVEMPEEQGSCFPWKGYTYVLTRAVIHHLPVRDISIASTRAGE